MSKIAAIQLAQLMISRSAFLQDRCKNVADYTDPDCLLPVMLHSLIGWEIANDYDALPVGEWIEISAMIEEGLASNDEIVGTAVATGLIEALIHRAEQTKGLWSRIEADLGAQARDYADAYRDGGKK